MRRYSNTRNKNVIRIYTTPISETNYFYDLYIKQQEETAMTLENFKKLADFKYNVGEYFGSELTIMDPKDPDVVSLEKTKLIKEGIGCVIKVQLKSKTHLAVLEDFDFEDGQRYIFTYYDKEIEKPVTVDTLFDGAWKILKDVPR